jgi:hypothetical protein
MAHVTTFEAYRLLPHVIPAHQRHFLERDGAVYGMPDHRWPHAEPGTVHLKLSCSPHTHVFRVEDVVRVMLRRTSVPGDAGLDDVTVEELPF